MRLLLVDDNPDHRFLTRRALRPLQSEMGLEVATVCDGEEALAWLRAHPAPDLVLLDVKMPRRNGFEVLQEVRADPALCGLRIILFSSSENTADLERARELGADDYLTKPLDASAFAQVVQDAVRRWAGRGRAPAA